MTERFGRFWLHECVGEGGLGEVYRATLGPEPHTANFSVALKRMRQSLRGDPVATDRFLVEADIGKLLCHPNLVTVYQVGLVGQHPYVAMEFVYGPTLSELVTELRMRHIALPLELALYIVLQILRALDYVHSARSSSGAELHIVHRDVTPQNVFVTRAGEVKLGDLGVAHVALIDGVQADDIAGKVAYIPPEQFLGAPTDERYDLWSVAMLAYELLANRSVPHPPEALIQSGQARIEVPKLHKLAPGIPKELSNILARALHKNPKRRFATATDFYRVLKAYLHEHHVPPNADELAQFIGTVFQDSRYQPPQSDAIQQPFEVPPYRVPMDMTPTQRIQRIQRERANWRWFAVGLILATIALASTALIIRERAHQNEAQPTAPRAAPKEPSLVLEPQQDDREESVPVDAEPEDRIATRYAAMMHRGSVQTKRRRYSSALQAYRTASVLMPERLAPKLGEVEALLGLERYQQAERALRGILRSQPKNARVHLLMGDAQWALGRVAAAKASYQTAVDLDPNGPSGRVAKSILRGL